MGKALGEFALVPVTSQRPDVRCHGPGRTDLGDPGGGVVPLGMAIGRAGMAYWPPIRAGVVAAPDPLTNIPTVP
jgi:hypothetical protein